MKSILIVEDEKGIHDVLEYYLENLDVKLSFAESFTEAKNKINNNNFDLILSDVHLYPDGSGIDLLTDTKTILPTTPFVIMTSFLSALDAKRAYHLGADEFVAKPINQDELRNKIMTLLGASEESYKQKEMEDILFCEVPIRSFISGKTAPFDIYIRIRPGKYIKVANKGDNYNYEILKKFEEKGIDFLHALIDEFQSYTLLNLKICKTIASNENINAEKKKNFLIHTSNILQENIFKVNLDDATIKYVNFYAHNMVNIIASSKEYLDLADHLRVEGPDIYNYSLLAALYALYMTEHLNWESDERKSKLFMAGMLHDVGMKFISQEIRDKNPLYLTSEEKTELDSHTRKGMETLSNLPNVPTEVILAAYQHHENVKGTGYPLKLKSAKISPFSKIIYITSHFSMYFVAALKQEMSPEMARTRAFHRFLEFHANLCDKTHLEAFKKIFSP